MTYRTASLCDFPPETNKTSVAFAQNFTVECLRSDGHSSHKIASNHETILVVPEAAITLVSSEGSIDIPKRSLVIIPDGQYDIVFLTAGRTFALTTGRIKLEQSSTFEQDGSGPAQLDPRVKPIGKPFPKSESADGGIRVYSVDDIPHPSGNPRLKFLQTSTMSINWVEYHGPRDRTKLSPHSHEYFEQGSLAITGDFIHHIRTPWGPNADRWRDDQHITAPSDSLLVIPPELTHTTEGVGNGHSVLVDVFAPPRKDFISKGWMHNAADYIDPSDNVVAADSNGHKA